MKWKRDFYERRKYEHCNLIPMSSMTIDRHKTLFFFESNKRSLKRAFPIWFEEIIFRFKESAIFIWCVGSFMENLGHEGFFLLMKVKRNLLHSLHFSLLLLLVWMVKCSWKEISTRGEHATSSQTWHATNIKDFAFWCLSLFDQKKQNIESTRQSQKFLTQADHDLCKSVPRNLWSTFIFDSRKDQISYLVWDERVRLKTFLRILMPISRSD